MKLFFVVTLATILFVNHATAQGKNFIDVPYLETVATFDTAITPNLIYIKVIVSENSTRNRVSVEELEAKMVDSLVAIGINPEKDITINDMLSNYRYYALKKKDVIKSKEYVVMVTNAATADRVFVALEALELSNATIIKLDHTDIEKFTTLCKVRALQKAQQNAAIMAKAAGQVSGNVLHIRDVAVAPNGNGQYNNLMLRGTSSFEYFKGKGFSNTGISFEKINVSAGVEVKVAIK
jgi:uncharacterized protein